MCAVKVDAANLINTVSYKTDRASLKKVRSDLKNLQSQFNKTMAANTGASPGASRVAVRAAKKTAEAMVDNHVKAFNDISKLKAKQNQKNSQRAINDLFGIGKPSKSARESASIFAAGFAEENKAVKEQAEKRAKYNKDMIAQQHNIDKLRKTLLAKRAKDEKKDRVANVASDRFAFDISRLGLQSKAVNKLTGEMLKLGSSYRAGNIDAMQYRESARQLLRTAKDQSKEYMTLRERLKDLRRGGAAGLGVGGMALGLGVAGAVGAGYIGTRMAGNALTSGVEQSRGLMKAQTMGLTAQEAQVLQMTIAQQSGFTLSYEKISDIAKDTQDKIGQLSMGQWKEGKDGKWAFSGGGEMADWLKIMTERGGYTREGSLSTLRNVKGPAELAVLLQSLRKSAKLTEDEVTALAEAINDFSYVAKSVGNDGENVINVMKGLVSNGLLYTDAQLENLKKLQYMAAVYDKSTDALQGSFSSSFYDGINKAGINSKNLADSLAETNPLVKGLGEFVGETAGRFLQLLGALPKFSEELFGTKTQVSESGWYYKDSALGGIIDGVKNFLTPTTSASMPSFMGGTGITGYQNNGIGGMAQQPIIVQPAPVAVTVSPSPEFGGILQAHTDDRIGYAFDNVSYAMGSTTLNN